MKQIKTRVQQNKDSAAISEEFASNIHQEVKELKKAVDVVCESCLNEKVDTLRSDSNDITKSVKSLDSTRKDSYIEAFENLKIQVIEIEKEWNSVSETMKAQKERLES
jgi:hypothetical protein